MGTCTQTHTAIVQKHSIIMVVSPTDETKSLHSLTLVLICMLIQLNNNNNNLMYIASMSDDFRGTGGQFKMCC